MNSIYITYTPYHILVSCGLASVYDYYSDKKKMYADFFENRRLVSQGRIGSYIPQISTPENISMVTSILDTQISRMKQ